jgi:hypothetical protein
MGALNTEVPKGDRIRKLQEYGYMIGVPRAVRIREVSVTVKSSSSIVDPLMSKAADRLSGAMMRLLVWCRPLLVPIMDMFSSHTVELLIGSANVIVTGIGPVRHAKFPAGVTDRTASP